MACVLAVALVAGCGRNVAAGSRPPGPELERALAAWSQFPVTATPRPLVLAGPDVTGPLPGFPSGGAKLAYLEGQFTFPRTMPRGPGSAGGFRVITAGQAAALLRQGGVKGPPAGTRLAVTTVRLGDGEFVTDRGVRRLPAWLFSFAGIRGPAAVLAAAPTQIFTPPVAPDTRLPIVNWAYGSPGGQALTVRFTGARGGHGPCTAGYTAQTAESPSAVAVTVIEHPHGGSNVACSAVAYSREVTIRLASPLGARVLVDAVSGAPIPVTVGHRAG